jgi:Ca2+-binding RTX toxin-like protein
VLACLKLEGRLEMTRRIGLATTIAAFAILTQGLLALVPAAAQADSASVSVTGGNTLQVVGDDTDNAIYESRETDAACPGGSPCNAVWSEGTVLAPTAPCIESDLKPGTGNYRALCPASGITGLVELGRGGDDQFYGDLGVPGVIQGGAGRDEIAGGSVNDSLFGGAGNDKLIGGPGNDLLKGNAGNDGMDGRGGHDRCIGGRGRDTPRHCERVRAVP